MTSQGKERVTIAELEAILDGPNCKISINPDGSLTTSKSDIEKLKLIKEIVMKPLADGEDPDYRRIFYRIQDILIEEAYERRPEQRTVRTVGDLLA